ncbi:hypothetical protein HDU67_005280, partial [Dinochytrium kinnereticum]
MAAEPVVFESWEEEMEQDVKVPALNSSDVSDISIEKVTEVGSIACTLEKDSEIESVELYGKPDETEFIRHYSIPLAQGAPAFHQVSSPLCSQTIEDSTSTRGTVHTVLLASKVDIPPVARAAENDDVVSLISSPPLKGSLTVATADSISVLEESKNAAVGSAEIDSEMVGSLFWTVCPSLTEPFIGETWEEGIKLKGVASDLSATQVWEIQTEMDMKEDSSALDSPNVAVDFCGKPDQASLPGSHRLQKKWKKSRTFRAPK